MSCGGAILRRKLLSKNAGFIGSNLGVSKFKEVLEFGAAFTTLTHRNDNNKCTKVVLSKNLRTRSHEFGFTNTTSSHFVRYASTNTTTFTPDQQGSSNVVYKLVRRICDPVLAIPRTFTTVIHMTSNDWAIKYGDCKIVYYSIMVRYRFGKKLLCADATIIKRLLSKITQGKCLSRRERQLLIRATADIFRLVPGSMFVAVPSIQFLLPLLLRFYPNILSPSFQDKITGQEWVMRKLKARTEYAKFLRETATEMAKVAQNTQSGHIKPLAEEFLKFWVDFGVGRPVSSEDIFRFTKLFSDELTLDHVSRPFMADMCKAMGITSFGTDEYLRFILWEKLKSIKTDDKLIQSKGLEALSESEVRKSCRERGIHGAENMRQQLRDWLDASLIHAVPSSLLIISRVFIETKKLKLEEAILATLSLLPYDLIYIVGVASLPCTDPILDKRRKIEALQLQEDVIKEEEKELLAQSVAIQDDVALKETNVLTPEQGRERAVDKQEQLLELISDATTMLTSVLNVSTGCDKLLRVVNKEMNLYSSYVGRKGPYGEREAIKAYRVAQEDNGEDAELDVGDNVSSALLNKANGMLQKLEKETDAMAANINHGWRVLERYCDGKVSVDVVAAAAFLKNTLDKEGIEVLIRNLSKYKEETVKLGVEAKDINQEQNQTGLSGTPLD